jgi:hypothetical protein
MVLENLDITQKIERRYKNGQQDVKNAQYHQYSRKYKSKSQ